MLNTSTINKIEKVLFYLLLVAGLVPLLVYKYIPTLDGPSHVYNANLISELLKGNPHVEEMFRLNSFYIPNWSGHLLLAFFKLFMPFNMAEKILMGIYIAGLPFFYRLFVRQIKGDLIASWLMLPFVFSFVFYLGFYNFCLATMFFFAGLSSLKAAEKRQPLHCILFALFSILIYFSHIVVFGLFVFTIFCGPLINLFADIRARKFELWRKKLVNILCLFLAVLPAGILSLMYISGQPNGNYISRLHFHELLKWIVIIRSLIVFNVHLEEKYTITLFILIILLIIGSVYSRINDNKPFNSSFFPWLVMAAISMGLYFILPDAFGTGGYMSVRLNWFVFIFILLWLSGQRLVLWLKRLTIGLIFFIQISLLVYHNIYTGSISVQIEAVVEASGMIEPNSTVLPFDFNKNLITGHLYCYAGADKAMTILNNYEGSLRYFPILWNFKTIPAFRLPGNDSLNVCKFVQPSLNQTARDVDYILFTGSKPDFSDPCVKNVINYCKFHTDLIFNKSGVLLFKCKKLPV